MEKFVIVSIDQNPPLFQHYLNMEDCYVGFEFLWSSDQIKILCSSIKVANKVYCYSDFFHNV